MPNIRILQASTTINGSGDNSTVQVGIVTDQICTASIIGVTPATYAWVLTPVLNSNDALSGVTSVAPTFTPTRAGIYLLSLNGQYTLPFLVGSSQPNVYQGPIVPASLTSTQAPVPAQGVSIISDSAKVGSLLTTDINGLHAPVALVRSGTTVARPASPAIGLYVGFIYFDTSLGAAGKPIWWSGTVWIDATGATV